MVYKKFDKKNKKLLVKFFVFIFLSLLILLGNNFKEISFDMKNFSLNPIISFTGFATFEEEEYIELLVKTSDNKGTNDVAEERAGNSKQGYIIQANPEGWSWGKKELDPKRFAIIKIPKSDFNEEWLEPEYDSSGNIITQRKYRLPLESFLTEEEFIELKNIPYNNPTYREPIIKTIYNISNLIEEVDWENRPEDMKLHGSSGTFTICPSGCDYTSLFNWEVGEESNLTGTGPCIANITEGFEEKSTVDLLIRGWTTTAEDYIKIVTTPEARHTGKFDSSKYFFNHTGSGAGLVMIMDSFVNVEGLQLIYDKSGVDTSIHGIYLNPGGENDASERVNISNNIIILNRDGAGMNGVGIYLVEVDDAIINIFNNVLFETGSAGSESAIKLSDANATSYIYSNTIVNDEAIGFGVRVTAGTAILKNNLVKSIGACYLGTYDGTSDYNACNGTDTTDTGTHNVINAEYNFVDYLNYDAHLTSSSTDVLDVGEDLSSIFTIDIDGQTRTPGAWDIGADEYVAGVVDITNPTALFGTNPIDNYNSSANTIIVDFKAFDDTDIDTISVYLNYSSWHANYTNISYTNDTYLNITLDALPDGKYLWGIFANDSAGNSDWSDTNRTFTIDTTAPTITLPVYTNATFKKNTDSLTLNISVSDLGSGLLNSVCLIDINGTNQSITLSDNWCNITQGNLTNLADGNHTIRVWVNDSANNFGLNDSYVVQIDTTSPNYTNNQTNSTLANQAVLFSLYVNDNVALHPNGQYVFSTNNTGTWVNESVVNFTTTPEWANVTKILNSTFGTVVGYRWYINDSLGNINNTEIYMLTTTDNINPTITLNYPRDNSNFSNTFSIICSDNLAVDYCVLYGNWTTGWHANATNSSVVNGSQTNFTIASLPEGKYLWGGWANDSAGNSAFSTINRTLIVDYTSPSVEIIFPIVTTYSTSTISFEAKTNENSTCNYSINGGLTNYSLVTNSTGTGHTASRTLSNANYIANFYCSDIVGNLNNTENVSFIVSVQATSPPSTTSSGGGGFSYKEAQFTTDYNYYEKTFPSNSINFDKVVITNPTDLKKEYQIKVQETENIISFEESEITIEPGSSKDVEFKISTPIKPGLYVGIISIISGQEKKNIPFSLNVRSEKNLFDITLFIPSSMKVISPGSTLTSQINLLEAGLKENIDVTLHYIIKDFTGRIYLDESETIAVYDQKELSKEFNTENLFSGDYVLGVELIYPGGIAVASSQFKVQEEIFEFNFDKIISFVIILVILFIFIVAIFSIKRYRNLIKKFKKNKIRNI